MAQHNADFDKLLATVLQWLKEGESEGWIYTEGYPNTICSQKHMNPWPIDTFRASGVVPKSPKEALETVWGWGTAEWKKFSADADSVEIKEDHEDTQVLFQSLALTWPLWYRDMVVYRKKIILADGTYVVLLSSSKDLEEKYPCDTSKFCRACVNIDSFFFAPVAEKPGHSLVTRVINFDPSGSLPSAVVNLLAKGNVFTCPSKLDEFWSS